MTPAHIRVAPVRPKGRIWLAAGLAFVAAATVTVVATAVAHTPRVALAAGGVGQLAGGATVGDGQPAPRHATTPHRAASPCDHNRAAQLVIVSIEQQHAWACAGRRTVLSTPVTTGATGHGDATPRGSFAVQGLDRGTTLTTSGGASYHVRYWIPFHLGVWGFHDASWQTMPFGSRGYVTRGSHGCVHVPLAAMRRLFHWVHYGTTVRIR